MVNFVHSKKGSVFIWLIIMTVLFSSITALVMDFSNIYLKTRKVKAAINRSVKAGVLHTQEADEMSEGYFLIDEAAGRTAFDSMLAENLGLDEATLEPLPDGRSLLSEAPLILEYSYIKNNTLPGATSYYSPTLARHIDIDNPSLLIVLEVKMRGVFLKKTLRVAKLSSSQKLSVFDI